MSEGHTKTIQENLDPSYRQAMEQEIQRRRHLETCTKKAEECSICFRQMVHEMVLIQTGKGKRASDKVALCNHWYRYTGGIPCTGPQVCIHCGQHKKEGTK